MNYLLRFKRMTLEAKAQEVGQRGEYLSTRYKDAHKVLLFALDNFYTEVWFQDRGGMDNMVFDIKGFDGVELLEPYLDNINIEPNLKPINLKPRH